MVYIIELLLLQAFTGIIGDIFGWRPCFVEGVERRALKRKVQAFNVV